MVDFVTQGAAVPRDRLKLWRDVDGRLTKANSESGIICRFCSWLEGKLKQVLVYWMES